MEYQESFNIMVTLGRLKEIIEEREPRDVLTNIGGVLRNFNTGLARTFGIPRAITDLNEQVGGTIFGNVGQRQEGEKGFNILPTSEEIQKLGSKPGIDITFAPGKEPDTLAARTVQNIGAAAPILPFFGLTAPIIGIELAASFGAAGGGKLLQQTEWGRKHPELARAAGELGGGLGTALTIPLAIYLVKNKGSMGLFLKWIKKLIPRTEKRVSKRLEEIILDPKETLRKLEAETGLPEGSLLTTAEGIGADDLARLQKTVEDEIPKLAAVLKQRRIVAINQLQKQFNKTGDISDARALLQEKLALRADQAEKAMSKIEKVSDPSVLSTNAERILAKAQKEGQDVLDALWTKLPKGTKVTGNNLNRVMGEEISGITEGGSINQISSVARQKLGRLNKEGKLVGGSLFSESKGKIKTILFDAQGNTIERIAKGKIEAEAKAVHQFYSLLGFEKARLGRIGGQGNKIRIINRLREAALDDLDDVAIGGDYKEVLKLTKEHHDKFTKGTVGRILGRTRGETPSPVTALEDIVGQGGVKAKENIQQALIASPQTKQQIQEFLKAKFAEIAVNDKTNRINAVAGNKFIEKFDNILDDLFPELKRDLKDAIARQADVDEFIGVPQVSKLSPLAKEKTATGFFLGKDPGEEIAALLGSKGVQRTNFLTDLVKITKTDSTGRALKGLQNSFTDELLKLGNVGEGVSKVKGIQMLNRLGELQGSVVKSGLFSAEEFGRLREIARVFRNMETVQGVAALRGGIIHDPISLLLGLPGRFIGARIGGRAGQDVGSSLVLASAGSKTITNFLKHFTNDEARATLIKLVTDKNFAKDVFKNITKLSQQEKGNLFFRIARKVDDFALRTAQGIKENIPRVPVTAVAPAAGSLGKSISDDDKREQRIGKIKALLQKRKAVGIQ